MLVKDSEDLGWFRTHANTKLVLEVTTVGHMTPVYPAITILG